MNLDFEWRVGPHCRLPCQLVHLKNRVHWPAVFVPSTVTEAPAIVADIANPNERSIQGSKLIQLK